MTEISVNVTIVADILNLHIGKNETNEEISIDNDLDVESSTRTSKFWQ